MTRESLHYTVLVLEVMSTEKEHLYHISSDVVYMLL